MGNFISWLEKNLPDPNQGDARGTQPQSLSGMVSTLVPVLITTAVYIVIFLFFRKSNRRFYAPRTYLGSLREQERSPELPNGIFNWFAAFWKIPDSYALQHQSLDSYLFIRFLRICCTICFVSLCITWPILFPINATGGNGKKQLEILGWSNINISDSTQRNRLYAHCFVAWIVYGFVIYTILRECIFYINVRQAFLLTPQYAKRISSRTVLFTSVPEEYLDEARIRTLFNDSVKHVWFPGDTKELDEIIKERDETAMKLEKGEVKLLKLVNKERINLLKKSGADAEKAASAPSDPESGNLAARWIPNKKRPTHRLGPLGLIGKKVDTIEWGREELSKLIPKADNAQAEWLSGNYQKHNAVFVEFFTQSDAQAAFQTTTHHHALHMAPRYIGVKPEEVVWKSLSIPWWQLFIRRYAVYAIIAALIVFWAIPVAIVGIIAQVDTIKALPGLTWIGDIPSWLLGVISGLLPSIALSILMSLVPVFMRVCAKLAGCVSLSQAELFTQNAYFCFQVLQVFLVRTLADSAVASIATIVKDPSQVFTMLSSSIPTSSNFYISYFIVQGLTIATSVLTQVVGCVIFQILYKFLAGTPRAMYTKWTTLSGIMWGSLLPVYTTIALISIVYAVIAPITLFWSTIGLGLFYLAYRYNILFVTETTIDTRGLIYPRALKQLFVGVYIAEVCMVGMFIVSKAAGPAVLMAAFLIFTILFQITMSRALDPLLYSLPRSLEVEEEAIQRSQQGSELEDGQANNGAGPSNGGGITNGARKLLPGGADGVQKQGNFFMKWLKPWLYADYATLRQLVPHENSLGLDRQYTDEVERDAYFPPSVTSATPVLWIPADPAGVSKQGIDKPITNDSVSKVLKSNTPDFAEGDLIVAYLPIAQYARVPKDDLARAKKINNPHNLDLGLFLGALGMPGLTAWSGLHKIGQPQKGETIFISSAAGAVGQIVGQVAKREGLTVIGSVGSDEKLDFIIKELGFDAGFNYKKESPKEALPRLAPNGIDIYFENVGGEHLEAALNSMNVLGRIPICGMISSYNTPASEQTGIKGLMQLISKQITMQGFLVFNPKFGPAYAKEHQENLQKWLADGSVKAKLSITEGIDSAADGLIGMLEGKNFGKAVLKI